MLKRIHKSLIFLINIILITGLLSGCSTTNTPTNEIKDIPDVFQKVNVETGIEHIDVYVDKETNVQYFIYRDTLGNAGGGDICPRYNVDGTMYINIDSSKGVVLKR